MFTSAFHPADATTIRVSAEGKVGRLTLNQPDKLNPLGWDCLHEIAEAARWFDSQPEVAVVIVTGMGRAFCAGADLGTFTTKLNMTTREAGEYGRRMADALEAMRAVAVCGIQGWCVGGGLVLAAACDLRVAAETAKFSIPEVDLGIPLAWGGIPRLVREIGPALTKELVMTCRPFSAEEGKSAGFLNRVVPDADLESEVEELARLIASKASLATAATKRHVNAVTDQMVGTGRSWSDADGLANAFGDPDCRTARETYLQSLGRQ